MQRFDGKNKRKLELDVEALGEDNSVLNNLERLLDETLNFSHLKLLSPRLFEIFPEQTESSTNFSILSPNLLSFSNGSGLFSLPKLFGVNCSVKCTNEILLITDRQNQNQL